MSEQITEEKLEEWAELEKAGPAVVNRLIAEVRRLREETKQLGREVARLEVCCRRNRAKIEEQRQEIERLHAINCSQCDDFSPDWTTGEP